ncbi:class I SAM-dependent methyltransferase [Methylobacterium sp. WL8]|uniref:class I SAM-dependent methyltransferase n=1 Tax=Methylobacterium sp. WL8 TaxID=2603899 RepID=UPI0011C95CBE|nr:class I SAM-dependent methyltransferase [Methylobacterium sp. WL8]TXN81965.1 class I SAM-dependent methyltransferase [Methylobacterium sp. WL8]
MPVCSVCGNDEFLPARPILWRELNDAWQISQHEIDYVNAQQGRCCSGCAANLRSVALATSIMASVGASGPLNRFVLSAEAASLRVLELNEAGTLHPILSQLPGHTFGAYPDVDMHALPFPDGTFDVVTHSDTLEHVENPASALRECARVLKPNGAVCYTVPVIVGRLTRGRAGLPKSWHGFPDQTGDDFLVHTEFGADFWITPVQAGLSQLTIHAVEFPAALAIAARR